MTCPEKALATGLVLTTAAIEARKGARRGNGQPSRQRGLFEFLRLRSHARHAAAVAFRLIGMPSEGSLERGVGRLHSDVSRLLELDSSSQWEPDRVADQVVGEILVRDLSPAVDDLRELALAKPVHPLTLSWEERIDVEDLILDRAAVRLVWEEAPLVVGQSAWRAYLGNATGDTLSGPDEFNRAYRNAVEAVRSIDHRLADELPPESWEGLDSIRREVYLRHFPRSADDAGPGQAELGPLLSADDLPGPRRPSRFDF